MNDHDFWTERLSALLDGDLTTREEEDLRRHLAGCPDCRTVFSELEEIRARARTLGSGAGPTTDLWPGIAARLGEDPLEDEVIDLTRHLGGEAPMRQAPDVADPRPVLPVGSTPPPPRARATRLAAAAVLVLAAGWTLGWAQGRAAERAGTPAGTVLESAGPSAWVRASAALPGDDGLADRIGTLEEIVRTRGGELPPQTAEVLRRNLAVIDRALEESLVALAEDPENAWLREHLDLALQRREAVLHAAVRPLVREG